MNITSIIDGLTTVDELKAYSIALFNANLDLQKNIKKLEDEKRHIEILLEQYVDSNVILEATDEEIVAKMEIKKLKDKAATQELTLEDSRKLETYNKIILSKQNKNKKSNDSPTANLTDDELMKLIHGPT